MAVYLGENQVGVYGGPVPPGSDKIKIKVQGTNSTNGTVHGYLNKSDTYISGALMTMFANNRDLYLPPTKDGKGLLFVYAKTNYGVSLSNTSTGATLITSSGLSGSMVIECESGAAVVLSVYNNS